MKVVNSLKSMKSRHKECRIIRRKGRLYVINKRNEGLERKAAGGGE